MVYLKSEKSTVELGMFKIGRQSSIASIRDIQLAVFTFIEQSASDVTSKDFIAVKIIPDSDKKCFKFKLLE